MANLTFRANNKEALRMLNQAIRAMKDFKIPLGKTARYQMEQINRQFTSEGSHILGAKWQPLKAKTVTQRIRMGFGPGPALDRTGRMRKGFKRKKLTRNQLEIGNDIYYFKYHESGTSRIPQRQMLGHSDKMMNDTLDIFEKHILSQIDG